MSGLTKEIRALTESDRALIMKVRNKRLLGASLASLASLLIIGFILFAPVSSDGILAMSLLFLTLALSNVYILSKEYRKLNEALAKGEKDVFSGIASSRFSKKERRYDSLEYYVVLKSTKDQASAHKKKISQLKADFIETENEEALDEYESMKATGNDNEPIRIEFGTFEQIKKGSNVEFHCLTEVYLASRMFNKDNTISQDLSYNNFFKLAEVVDNKV